MGPPFFEALRAKRETFPFAMIFENRIGIQDPHTSVYRPSNVVALHITSSVFGPAFHEVL